MKRIIGFVMGIILTIGVMVFSLSACGFNKQIFDFTYEYNTAIINMFDGTVKAIVFQLEMKQKYWNSLRGAELTLGNCHL